MALELMEGAVSTLQNYLSAHFADEVAALNAVYSDAIVLPDIAAVYDVEQVEVQGQAYPFVEVIGIRTDVLSETGAMMRSAHNIAIMITDTDSDRSYVRRRIMRYCRGVFELLRAAREDPTFSGYTVVLSGGAIDFLPLRWRRQTARSIGTAIIGCQLTTLEVFP